MVGGLSPPSSNGQPDGQAGDQRDGQDAVLAGRASEAGRSVMKGRAPAPIRAEDALFLHAQTPLLCQQVGAVVLLEPPPLPAAAFGTAMRQRTREVPELHRRLERPRKRWRRARWVADRDIDFDRRIRHVTIGEPGRGDTVGELVDSFFSVPCDPYTSPWEMLLVHGMPGERTAVAVKVHHALGDSYAIIAALGKLFDPDAPRVAAPTGEFRSGVGRSQAAQRLAEPEDNVQGSPNKRVGRLANPVPDRVLDCTALRSAVRGIRGLWHLAAAGRAPEVSVCGPFTSDRRRYVPITLPAREVAVTARGLNVGITDYLVAMIAEAIGRLLRSRGENTDGRVIRAVLPRISPSATGRSRRSPANRSAAVSLDLPIGPMVLPERLTVIAGQVEAHQRRGEPEAAAIVLRAMNCLPLPIQRRAAASLYQRRWFNMLVSVFPGERRSHRFLGAQVGDVYPVLALADGVGLAIGAMTWDKSLSIGILADSALVPDVDRLAAELRGAFVRSRHACTAPLAAP